MNVAEFDCVYCGAPVDSLTEEEYMDLRYEYRDSPESFAPVCKACAEDNEADKTGASYSPYNH